jgi:outer membrane protein assembly complex protein YaeT
MVRTRLAYVSYVLLMLAAARRPVLLAQPAGFEGQRVVDVQFQPLVQPLEPGDLNAILPLKKGQPLRMADVRASIERLFATGRYADIQVDAEPEQDGVAIRFITKNSWFIGDVSIRGDVPFPPSSGQLENATRLDLGQPFTEAGVRQATANQARLLENDGFFRNHIQPLYKEDDRFQQMNIAFSIAPGPRARLDQPLFEGNLQMDPQRVLHATKFRRWIVHSWKPVTDVRVRQGIEHVRTLYLKENRLEAKVSLESMQYHEEINRAVPTLHIDAGPRIDVRTIGVKLSEKRLQRYVPVFEEHTVDPDLLAEGERNLRDYFQSQGYFEAAVRFEERRISNDESEIDYLVTTGKRHRLVKIGIAGNRYFDTASLRERMFLQPVTFLQFPHGRYSSAMLERDEASIANLYRSNGFRDAKVTHRVEDNYRSKSGDIAVFLTVDEGPQYLIGSLEVAGIERLNKAAIVAKLSAIPGQPYSEFNVAVDRDTILAQYFDRGFPNATFEWSSKPAAAPHRMDLRFTIAEGPEQFVRQVVSSGLTITQSSLVDSIVTLKPGDPLSLTRITDIQRKFYDLGIFARVDAAIQDPDGETSRKYVLYSFDEARRYSMAVGFGAELGRIGGCETCYDAPAGATGFSPRISYDITRNNLWGLGHSLTLRTRASTLDQLGLLNYSWPRFRNSDNLNFSFTGQAENSRDVRTFNFRREEGSVQLSQRFSKSLMLLYRYTYRLVAISDLKITPFLIPQLSQPVRVGIASTNLVHDRRDNPLDPHRGIYDTIDLGLADRGLGSQRDFARFLARNATYYPLGKRLVLARSTEFGDIYAFHYAGDVLDAVPLPERFFGGGNTTDRGFPDEQAGPRDTSTGFPLGGTALFFNQVELRFPLIGENIGGVLFHDMGNVYSSLGNLSFRTSQRNLQDFDYMVHAVGFGLRYQTPVGPVRLDLAYSINPPYFYGFNGTQQELINAGVDPCAPPAPLCSVQNVSHFQFFVSIGQTF